ncbi:hypothetical protein Q2941_26730 [Bradyrhizobium sp. UFLA05-153]
MRKQQLDGLDNPVDDDLTPSAELREPLGQVLHADELDPDRDDFDTIGIALGKLGGSQ